MSRKKILVSAFDCNPRLGSESAVGWNWVKVISEKYDVVVMTQSVYKEDIERELKEYPLQNLQFEYVYAPVKSKTVTVYWQYISWQKRAYKVAKRLIKQCEYDYVWHLTWGTIFLPTYMYKLDIPFIFGAVAGGEQVPQAFWKTFPLKNQMVHRLKKFMSQNIELFPWVYRPIKKAKVIITKTHDTKALFSDKIQYKVFAHQESCIFDSHMYDYPLATKSVLNKCEGIDVICTGRIIDIKNIDCALNAVHTAIENGNKLKLHIFGDGNLTDRLKSTCKQLGIEDCVEFYGNVDRYELFKAVDEADVYVFPSLRDAAASSLLEAMAFAKPIIAFDLNGMHETLSPDSSILVNIDGLSAEEANEKYAQNFLKLINLPESDRKQLGEKAKERLYTAHGYRGIESFIDSLNL